MVELCNLGALPGDEWGFTGEDRNGWQTQLYILLYESCMWGCTVLIECRDVRSEQWRRLSD